jgi:anthranilate phosphoribosyltransferase
MVTLDEFYLIRQKQMDKKQTISIVLFISGICIALIGAGIMFHGNVFGERNSGIATIIGIIGIGLIATSNFRLLK